MSSYQIVTPLDAYRPLHITTAISSLTGVGRCFVASVAVGTIAAGVRTITVASVAGLYQGQHLNVNQGASNPYEDVTVLAVDPVGKTFTALFVNGYTGTVNFVSRTSSHLGGFVVNKAGSGITLTLANGSPLLYPLPTDPEFGTIAVSDLSVLPLNYRMYCAYGLFISITGTIGDYTLLHRSDPL